MSVYHDEVEIEDFEYDEETDTYYYPCPCGDKFQITKVQKLYLKTIHSNTNNTSSSSSSLGIQYSFKTLKITY
jgi:hypothetical protein